MFRADGAALTTQSRRSTAADHDTASANSHRTLNVHHRDCCFAWQGRTAAPRRLPSTGRETMESHAEMCQKGICTVRRGERAKADGCEPRDIAARAMVLCAS